jgi:hypothetical protein
MKTRIIILLAIVALLLIGCVALAQSSGPPSGYVVIPGTASGGHYRLTSLSWQVSGASSGGGYRLLPALSGAEGGPASPTLRGNGCCCTYLPCVLRK